MANDSTVVVLDSVSDFNEEELTLNWLRQVMGPVGIVGIFCNILIIATVFKLEDARNSASGRAIQLLALWDTMAVLGDAVFEMTFKSLLSIDIFTLDSHSIMCKALKSFDWLGNHTANWHVVIVCLDRYLSVAHPSFYFSSWSQRHVGLLSIAAAFFTWLTQIPFLFLFKNRNGACEIYPERFSLDFVDKFIKTQVYVLYMVVPGFLVLTLSLGFVYKLKSKKVKGTTISAERQRVESAFQRMIVSLIISYTVLATASCYTIHLGVSQGESTSGAWAYNLGDGLLVLQSSINLIFYIVSGPMFRKALKKALTCA